MIKATYILEPYAAELLALREDALRQIVKEGGAEWLGIQEGLTPDRESVMFNDPTTGSSCSIYTRALRSAEDVEAALKRKREEFQLVKTAQMLQFDFLA